MNKYIYLLLSSFIISFSACSDDDKSGGDEIKIDQQAIKLKKGEKTSFKILEGNGNYRVFSLNEAVATVTENEAKTAYEIDGLGYGQAKILIADGKTNIQSIPVSVIDYDAIKTDGEDVIKVTNTYGQKGSLEINLLETNGNVTYKVTNTDLLSYVNFKENKLTATINFSDPGTADIIFTDECNITKKITVVADVNYAPLYPEDYYAEILKDSSIRYFYGDDEEKEYLANQGVRINTIVEGVNTYGWQYKTKSSWNPIDIFKKISFKGDKTVGDKTEGTIEIKAQYGAVQKYDLKYSKIAKVEDGKLWFIYSYVGNYGSFEFGYFVDKVSAE